MQYVKDLITKAYRKSGLLGDGEEISGTDLKNGLDLFNRLTDLYNAQSYLPFTQRRLEVPANSSHVIVLYEDDGFTLPEDDDAVQTSYSLVKIARIPVAINSLAYKIGNMWQVCAETGLPDLQKYIFEGVSSSPSIYAFTKRVYVNEDTETVYRYAEIWLDVGSAFTLGVVYNKRLPEVSVNSAFAVPDMSYDELFLYGLAAAIATDGKLPPEEVAPLAARESAAMALIKELNKNQHLITWGDSQGAGWNPAICPPNWRNV